MDLHVWWETQSKFRLFTSVSHLLPSVWTRPYLIPGTVTYLGPTLTSPKCVCSLAHAYGLPDSQGYVRDFQDSLCLFHSLDIPVKVLACLLICTCLQPVSRHLASYDVGLPWLFATEIAIIFSNATGHGFYWAFLQIMTAPFISRAVSP